MRNLPRNDLQRGGGKLVELVPQAIVSILDAAKLLEDVQARSGCIGERFRHEGGTQPELAGGGADRLADRDELIGHVQRAGGPQVDFLLTWAGFVVRSTEPYSNRCQRRNDRVAGA